jgi:hypothetical protein
MKWFMTSYFPFAWPLLFFMFFVLLIPYVEWKRQSKGIKVSTTRLVAGTLLLWLCSTILFYLLNFSTYHGGTISHIWAYEMFNAFITLAITTSIWYTLTTEIPLNTPIPISFTAVGIVCIILGFAIVQYYLLFIGNIFVFRSTLIYIGLGIVLIITGILARKFKASNLSGTNGAQESPEGTLR